MPPGEFIKDTKSWGLPTKILGATSDVHQHFLFWNLLERNILSYSITKLRSLRDKSPWLLWGGKKESKEIVGGQVEKYIQF